MILVFVIPVVSAFIGAAMANSRNRNPILWAAICFFFPLIGIIILAASGSENITPSASSAPRGGDLDRWRTLKEVDAEIARAAIEAHAIGPEAEQKLAQKFLTLNDKSYLPALLQNLRDEKVAMASEVRSISGHQCKVFGDGSVVIIRGKHVGKTFSSISELEGFLGN